MTTIESITELCVEKTVTIKGTVRSFRPGKKISFMEIYDGPFQKDIIQCFTKIDTRFEKQAYVIVQGIIRKLPESKKSVKPVEIEITHILHHSTSSPDLDTRIQEGCGTKVARQLTHLHLRHEQPMLHIMLHDLVTRSLDKTAYKLGLIHIDAPSFGSVKCEGGSDVFEMDYFGKKVYFTQSSQMYIEVATAALKRGTFCSQYSYRAEKSRTKRHLTQFKHFEVEMPGFTTFEEFLAFLEKFIRILFETIVEEDRDHLLETLGRSEFVQTYLAKPFTILSHEQAIEMLRQQDIKKSDGTDFGPYDDIPEAAERKLIDQIDTITFLTKFPAMTKAFYALSDPQDKTRALAADIEFPFVGEIIGSSLREWSYDELRRKLQLFTLRDVSDEIMEFMEKHLGTEPSLAVRQASIMQYIMDQDIAKLEAILLDTVSLLAPFPFHEEACQSFMRQITDIPYHKYDWYMDLRKYGSLMTGGFGLGVERLVTWLAGGSYDILDSTTFIRTCDISAP